MVDIVYFGKSLFLTILIVFLLFDLHYISLLTIFVQEGMNIYIMEGGGKCGHRSKGNVLTPSSHIFLFMY